MCVLFCRQFFLCVFVVFVVVVVFAVFVCVCVCMCLCMSVCVHAYVCVCSGGICGAYGGLESKIPEFFFPDCKIQRNSSVHQYIF